ncbi:tyrosine-type recombinase/integrase [Fimbriiglobus ruber]|uniref:Integrase n=1 Tax=Fimbriiglobus ruber TaxID=1908690 RepID=A0A225DVH1_9BACT|nr:site-specific integrase [Fimbriiglobus ruber]OWK45540.1 Integrase [Fimbriiglobus ruber]
MPQTSRPWFRKQTGWWMAQVNHKQEKLAKGKENKREAEQKLRDLLSLQAANPQPDSGRLTVAAVIDLYIEFAKSRLDPTTLEERKRYFQAFAEAHGFRAVNDRDCLPYHLTAWIDSKPEWQSDWTKNHAVAIIHRPFNWAAKQRLIAANPFRGVTHRPGAPRRPMTDDEFKRLVVASHGRQVKVGPNPGDRFVEFLRFLRLTGARPCEASKLRWTDINLDSAVVMLVKHKSTKTQRTPKPRVISLDAEIVRLLITIRARNEVGEFVFYNHRGTTWNRSNLSLRLQRGRKKANIPPDAKLYGLRHAFGTRAILNGVDIKTLAELMGHTTTRVTEHYVHIAGNVAHLHAALQKVNGSVTPLPVSATPPAVESHPDARM